MNRDPHLGTGHRGLRGPGDQAAGPDPRRRPRHPLRDPGLRRPARHGRRHHAPLLAAPSPATCRFCTRPHRQTCRLSRPARRPRQTCRFRMARRPGVTRAGDRQSTREQARGSGRNQSPRRPGRPGPHPCRRHGGRRRDRRHARGHGHRARRRQPARGRVRQHLAGRRLARRGRRQRGDARPGPAPGAVRRRRARDPHDVRRRAHRVRRPRLGRHAGGLRGLRTRPRTPRRRPWAELLAPAISAARDGFPLGAAAASYLALVHDSIFGWDEQTRAFHSCRGRCPTPPVRRSARPSSPARSPTWRTGGGPTSTPATSPSRSPATWPPGAASSPRPTWRAYDPSGAARPAEHAARLEHRGQPSAVDRWPGADGDAADAGPPGGPRAGRPHQDPARGAGLPAEAPGRVRGPARGGPRPDPHGHRAEPGCAADVLLDRPRVGRRQ